MEAPSAVIRGRQSRIVLRSMRARNPAAGAMFPLSRKHDTPANECGSASRPHNDRRKSRIACLSLRESALKLVITWFASEAW